MLSSVPEKKMRLVRGALTLGWLVLIVSLFWDPVTPEFTRPDNAASPFHIKNTSVEVQGHALTQIPYQMTNKIFWTMIIPVLPLFFMVAGHETWRRLCPLSFISQIPRYLGWNRKIPVLDRRTGQVEKRLALVNKNSFWRKNVWYIQFGLLFVALNARILFVNSDRTSLGLFLIFVIIAALVVGYLWGGKTWCNYLCPVAIVQKIYTEPRGLLESQAHISKQTVSQSMCRTSTNEGDKSTCVGCTQNCPDTDLERSYWSNIEDPSLRYVYYGFFGLIVGFFSFFYFYSGNWDYYMSGAWTHEPDVVGKLFKPGLYINGELIGIPKVLSAPMILGTFVLLAILLGKGLETLYRFAVKHSKNLLSEQEIISHCLIFSSYISINTFYLFGGRPNLLLLPYPALRFVDILIVALTTSWFLRSILRTPTLYRRESLASSLAEQLRKLKLDITEYLEGRKIEELKVDEIYILAKTLPSFSRSQRVQAYRNILEDWIRKGRADSSASLELLREVRADIGVTDDEHQQILQDIGIDETRLDATKAASYEDWIRLENYRGVIEPAIVTRLEMGERLADALENSDIKASIKKSREIYQISEEEHVKTITSITGAGSMILDRAHRQLALLSENAALIFGLRLKIKSDSQWNQIGSILIASSSHRSKAICKKLFSVLLTLGDTPESRSIAKQIANILGPDVEEQLIVSISNGTHVTWADTLISLIVDIIRGTALRSKPTDERTNEVDQTIVVHPIVDRNFNLESSLKKIALGDDQIIGAVALTAISDLNVGLAHQIASEISKRSSVHRLLNEVVYSLSGNQGQSDTRPRTGGVTLTVATPNSGQQTFSFAKDYVSVGRASDNDVVVAGQVVSSYHFVLCRTGSKVEIRKSSSIADIYINGQRVETDGRSLLPGDRVSFLPSSQPGPMIVVEWSQINADYVIEHYDTVTKLIWLSQAYIFRGLDLTFLAEIASDCECRLYKNQTWLCRYGDSPLDAFLIHSGSAEALSEKEGRGERRRATDQNVNTLDAGMIVGELGVITGRPRAASVRISSDVAMILVINGERLRWLMEREASVSMSLLSVVASYERI